MAVETGAKFTLTAGVVGQAAIDKLRDAVGGINDHVGRLPGLAKGAGLALAGLGAGLSLGVFKGQFDGMVESMLAVKDAAERVGSSVEGMGRLSAVARASGEDFGMVEGAITKMVKSLAGSDDEAKGAAHALDSIGLSIKDLRKLDPADAFDKIATALGDFEGNGAKTAVVMDIFGKSGAQLLPFLNDYIELSGVASKVTAEQADMADMYDKAVRKLTASKQDLYKVITSQALPAATDFVQALLDVTNGTNGVKSAVKDLSTDGTMTSVFREGARAAAALMDVMSMLLKGVSQLGESFGVVWNDIKTGAKLAALGIGAGFTEEGRAAMAAVIAERDAYMAKVGSAFDKRWDGSLTPYSDALEARFAKRDAGGSDQGGGKPTRTLTGYQSRTPTPAGGGSGGADPYATELQSLGREAAKLQWQIDHIEQFAEKITSAKEAQVQFDVEVGKYRDLGVMQKEALLAAARAVDQNAESLRQAQVELEVTKQTKAIEANTAALGQSTTQRELAAFAQDLENKGIKEGTDRYNRLMEARKNALSGRDAAKGNPLLGVKEAINEIGDTVNDRAAQMKDVLTNAFNGAADALTNFVMTGKLNFADFARSVISDLAKMIIKQTLFNALAGGTGSSGGGLVSAVTSFFGFANGGAFSSGGGLQAFATGGVVDQPTLFKFASGGAMRNGLMGEAGPEAIMPLKRGADGKLGVVASGSSGGDVNVSVTVNAQTGATSTSGDSGQSTRQLGQIVAAKVREIMVQERRPGGLLAA